MEWFVNLCVPLAEGPYQFPPCYKNFSMYCWCQESSSFLVDVGLQWVSFSTVHSLEYFSQLLLGVVTFTLSWSCTNHSILSHLTVLHASYLPITLACSHLLNHSGFFNYMLLLNANSSAKNRFILFVFSNPICLKLLRFIYTLFISCLLVYAMYWHWTRCLCP